MGLENEIIINGEVYVRKSANASSNSASTTTPVNLNSVVDSLQEKFQRQKLGQIRAGGFRDDNPDGAALSVNSIKDQLRLKTAGGVLDGVEIGQEARVLSTAQEMLEMSPRAPPSPSPTPPPVYSNNNFMKRNVRVREWRDYAIRDSEEDHPGRIETSNSFAPASEDIPLNKNASSNMSMNSAANIAAIQIEAVDTLKKKLEMKKQATKQDVFVGSALASGGAGYGSVMLKTQDVDTLQSGTGRNEVFSMRNQGQKTKYLKDGSDLKEVSDSAMVDITSNKAATNAKITFSSFDKSKEDYMKQFSEKSRPVSEVSPIKAELESIINNKIYESNESKQILITSRTTPDVHHSGNDEAQKTAFENDFLKQKQSEFVQEIQEVGPISVGAGRQQDNFSSSFTPSVEYKEIKKSSSKNGPNITFANFSSSGTDYTKLTKAAI